MINGPTWLGIGAQRCGTTWFTDLLTQHPQMEVANGIKEHHWLYRYGLTQEWTEEAKAEYRETFSSEDLMLGEWTPYYMRAAWVPQVVADILPPDTPILVLLRDPIDRYASALRREMEGAARRYRKFVQSEKKGVLADAPKKVDKGGKQAPGLKKKLARIAAAAGRSRVHGPPKPPSEAIIDRTWLRFVGSDVSWGGMYAAQLDLWMQVLPEERFMVIQYEKLRRDPQHYADLVWKRLGLDPVPLADIDRPSGSSTKSETWQLDDYPALRRALQYIYRPDAERLAQRFDIDLELWKRTMS